MTALTVQSVYLGEKDFQKVSDIVCEHCGINLYKDKRELIRARVTKRLRLGNFKTFSEYIKYVLDDKTGKEFSLLIDSLSTNLTSFFREVGHLELIPSLLRQKYMIDHRKENHKVFEVSQILRDTVTFKHMNLVKHYGNSETLDFIFCRNVMIYFDKLTRERLVNRFYNLLNSRGVLCE